MVNFPYKDSTFCIESKKNLEQIVGASLHVVPHKAK